MASRESEDDDLPETVSFQEAKKVSLDVSRQQNENLKRHAAQLKGLRRARQERNIQQKREKKIKTDLSPLPQELLKEVKQTQEDSDRLQSMKEVSHKVSEEKLQKRKKRKRDKPKTKVLRSGKTVVVKIPPTDSSDPSYSQLSAEEFLHRHFFASGLERVPVHHLEKKRVGIVDNSTGVVL